MTIPEIAAQLRLVLRTYILADKDVSPAERIDFVAHQKHSSDEKVIVLWLSVTCLDTRQLPMFTVEQWAKRATSINHWMTLLEANTTPPANN
jgi:hypothetical protein